MTSRQRVKDLVSSALDTRFQPGLPSSFTFHPQSPLVYFIGRPDGEQKSSLFYAVLPHDDADDTVTAVGVEWRPLLPSLETATSATTNLSKEEELLRERMRSFGSGITGFTLHEQSGQLLIPAAGKLFTVDVSQHSPESSTALQLHEIPSDVLGARMDAKFCPHNPNIVSFVRNGDLWLVDREHQREKRLTHSRTSEGEQTMSSGVAEFVMQEEFDRYTGYWWQPCTDDINPALCRILYLEVDESQVDVYTISDAHGKADSFRYPLAGGKNAASRVCLVEFDTSDWEGSPVVKPLQPSVQEQFPWAEYIVRCGWTAAAPSSPSRPWLQLLDRKQQRLQLVAFALSAFSTTNLSELSVHDTSSTHQVLLEDVTETWINVTNVLHFLRDGSGRFLWASEVHTGYRQLYLVTPGPQQSTRAITTGQFQVEDQTLTCVCMQVDERRQLVFFTANKDSPLETHLYAASYAEQANAEHIHRLTVPGFHHGSVAVKPTGDVFVSVYSNLATPYEAQAYRLLWPEPPTIARADTEHTITEPTVQLLFALRVPRPTKSPVFPAAPPQLFSFTNHWGELAYGVYWRPPQHAADEAKRYPVLLYVYGGPHAQLVVNSYALTGQYRRYQLLAAEGVVCVMIDGTGSWKRGLAWEGRLRNRMGTVEIHDQILGLEHLMRTHAFIDPTRVGVTGWSYGGYLSLAFLAQRPDFFKIAVAGGPVTLWEDYDTGYTERYMDTPQNNPEGYSRGSILNMVAGLPDEEDRLLLLHGLIDENVHFGHTAKLIDELMRAGKPYRLQVFPTERHGVRTPYASRYLEMALVSFVLRYL